MKNIIKKITAIAMCGVLIVGSVLMTGAVSEYENRKDFEVTGTTQKISNNQLFVTTTGYTENTAKNFGAMFISTDYQKYSVMFKDCIDAPKFVNLPKNQEFTRHMITADNRYFGDTGMKFNYDSTGGEYVKIRIKLSDYFPDGFNDDGTMTGKLSDGTYKNFDFTYEDFGTDSSGKPCYATSGAYFVSGGAVTSFVPDKNGYAEFYISRQLGEDTGLIAYKYCRLKNGAECKTTIGGKLNCLTCGDAYPDGNITVGDATSVQKYVVGIVKFGKTQLFNSDVNHDGEISVVDATLIQKYIVGLI